MDCIIDIVHRYVGFNPKLEPIETTNVEDTTEYKMGYEVGFENGKKQAIEEIPELADKENEIYNDGYNKGLEDAWKLIVAIETDREVEEEVFGEDLDYNFDNVSVQDAMKKWKAYEEKKQADEIKVGDVVKFNEKCHSYEANKDREYLVLHSFGKLVTLLYDNGDTGAADISLLDKTGRHVDEVSQLLDMLRGEE